MKSFRLPPSVASVDRDLATEDRPVSRASSRPPSHAGPIENGRASGASGTLSRPVSEAGAITDGRVSGVSGVAGLSGASSRSSSVRLIGNVDVGTTPLFGRLTGGGMATESRTPSAFRAIANGSMTTDSRAPSRSDTVMLTSSLRTQIMEDATAPFFTSKPMAVRASAPFQSALSGLSSTPGAPDAALTNAQAMVDKARRVAKARVAHTAEPPNRGPDSGSHDAGDAFTDFLHRERYTVAAQPADGKKFVVSKPELKLGPRGGPYYELPGTTKTGKRRRVYLKAYQKRQCEVGYLRGAGGQCTRFKAPEYLSAGRTMAQVPPPQYPCKGSKRAGYGGWTLAQDT